MAYDDVITFGSAQPTTDSQADVIHFGGGASGASMPVGLPTPEDTGPTLSDHLNNLYGAGWQAIGAVRRGVAQLQPDEESRKVFDAYADEANNNAIQHLQDMTPSGRDTATQWNKHWIQGALMGAEQQFPMLGAAALGEFAAGPVGSAAVFGALSAGQAADNFYRAIREMPEDKLMDNPDFAKLVNSGMSMEDAKTTFAHQHVNDAEQMLVGAVTGAGVGTLGPVGKLFGRGLFDATSQSILKNMATKGLEAGGAMAVQSGFMDVSQQQALMGLNLPSESTTDILEQAGKMGLWGGAIGSLGGMRRGPALPTPPTPPDTRLPWKAPTAEERLLLPRGTIYGGPPEEKVAGLLPKPAWQTPDVGEGIATPTNYYAYPTGEEGAFRTGEGMPMGAPDIPALPKPAWQPPEVGEGVGRPRPGPFGRPRPIAPELSPEQQDWLDQLRRWEGEGGPPAREEPGVTPTADKSMEPSQTPSAPLKSAQAAPMMPDKETLTTDAAKKGQAQDRHDTPVSGQAAPIRSGRVGRTKPAAGRDFGPTEATEGEGHPPIASSVADDAHVEALKAAFEQEEQERQQPTTDSQLPPELQARLDQFTPEQRQQLVDTLRQGGRGGIADMLQRRGGEEPPPAEPPPEPPPRPPPPPSPSPAGGGIPFMITRAMKAQLKERGFTDDQIINMTPAQAHGHLQEPVIHTPSPSSEEGLFPPPTPAPPRRTPPPVYSDEPVEQAFRGEGKAEPIQDVVHTGREPTAEEIAAAEKEEGYKPTKAGHVPKWKVDARERNNKLADKVVGNHSPPVGKYNPEAAALLPDSQGGKGSLAVLRTRVNAMLNEAKEKGVEIPKEFTKLAEGGVDHSPSVLLLNEAQRFLKHIAGKFDEEDRIKAVEKFLMREKDLREGRYEDVLAERGKEAEAALAKKKTIARGEAATEADKLAAAAEESQLSKVTPQHIKTPEEELIRKQRLKAAQKLLSETIKRWNDAQKKGIKGVADIKDMQEIKAAAQKAFEQARELGFNVPDLDKSTRGEHPLQTLRRALAELERQIKEEREAEHKEGLVTVRDGRTGASDNADTKARPTLISNVREMMAKVDYSRYHPAVRGMMKILVKKIVQLAGDVPVYAFDNKEWLKFMNPEDDGGFSHRLQNIVIHQDRLDSHVPVHEAFHAITAYVYKTDIGFMNLVDRLHGEIIDSRYAKFTPDVSYAVHGGPLEMLTEMMSNPKVQEAFKDVLISPELARELGIEDVRKASIFRTILDKLREALGFEPKYLTAIEAAAAITQRGINLKYPTEAARFQRRLGEARRAEQRPTIDSQPDLEKFTRITPENLKQGYDDIRDRIKYEPASVRLNLKRWFDTPREWGLQLLNKGHFAKSGAFRKWLEHMSQQGYERTQFLKRYLDVAKSIATLGIKKPQEFTKLVDLLLSAARNGAHPDDELFKDRNAFLKLTNPNHWEAIAGHPSDRKKYMALSPETQKIFRDIRDKMTEIHKSDLEAARKSLVDNYRKYASTKSKEFQKAFEKVAKDEELTPLEEAAFGDDPYLQDIHTYNRAIGSDAGKMFYFPMKRTAWKFAITGSHKYDAPSGMKANKDDPHRWIFDDPSKAYAFTRDVGLPSYREVRYYYDKDENGKPMEKEYTGRAEVRQIAGENVKPKKEFHVVVDPEHTEFANSKTEGERIREAMRKHPTIDPNSISGVMPVKGQALKHFGFYGPQIEAMVNRVGKLEHLNPRERKAAQDAIEHTAIASMRGNYLPQSLLPRRRIMGTDNIDIIKSFWDRVRASANFQTMANHRSGIDDALKEMEEEVRSKRTNADATELNAFYNMVEDRTMNFQNDDLNDMNMSTLMHHIQSFGVIKYLASPAFLAYHQLHVPLVVIPALSKHVGFLKASKMAFDAYRQMSGGLPIVGKGIKGGWERAWNYDKQPTDFIDALMQELKKHGGKDDELAAMKWAVENDIMHHTGINFSSYFKGMGQAERFEQRAMGVSAEIIGAADAVNRFNSMLMFYRAAKGMGKEGEEAFRWAGDRVAETQGQFTAFNRVGLMKNPNMRAVLQFKSFPLILMKTVTKAFYNSLRWDASTEERVDGLKTLAGLMGASMALSGVQGAVPEPIEDIANIASALGLIDSWDQYEDELRGYVADNMGSDVATLVMNGVVGGGLGTDLTHRGGISDLTGFARLHVTKSQDLENALFKWMSGVPGSVLGDGIDGMNGMETGDVPGMLKGFLPRVITDPVKAYQDYNQGVTTRAGKVITPPLGLPDTLKQALGLTPLTASLAREARYVSGEEKGEQQTQRTKIEQMYAKGDKGYAIRAMNDYNRVNPDNPIRPGDLKKAAKETTKKKVFGMDIPKQPLQRQELEHRREAYGLQPQ